MVLQSLFKHLLNLPSNRVATHTPIPPACVCTPDACHMQRDGAHETKDAHEISANYNAAITASIRLGVELAKVRSTMTEAAFNELLADEGIKPTEAQSYLNLAHKSVARKPRARRAPKSTKSKRY